MTTETLDAAALDRLAALEQAADLAEWVTYPNGSEGSPYRWAIAVADAGRPARSYRIGAFDAHGGRERENADLIAALRNAAPALIALARAGLAAEAELGRLCRILDTLEGAVDAALEVAAVARKRVPDGE